jgi:hypothetical protein
MKFYTNHTDYTREDDEIISIKRVDWPLFLFCISLTFYRFDTLSQNCKRLKIFSKNTWQYNLYMIIYTCKINNPLMKER